jgi:restriction endonuclease S subunit
MKAIDANILLTAKLLFAIKCIKEIHAVKMILSQLANISSGHPIRGAVDELPDGSIGVIQMRNIGNDGVIQWDDIKRVSLSASRSTTFLSEGDVIFSTRGTRNHAITLKNIQGEVVCSPHFFVLRVANSNILNPEYLAWYINQKPSQDYFQKEATGSYILNIRKQVVESLQIVVPPMGQQKSIVEFDKAVRAENSILNELLRNRAKQMEALAMSLETNTERA